MSTNAQDIHFSELEGFEQVETIIAGRPLNHFSFVHSFRYFACREDELGNTWNEIELVMGELEEPHARFGIRFRRVAVEKFDGFGQITGLFFQNIRERGWEGHRFEVGDYEESRIHLFCHEISVFDPCGGA